MNLNLSLLPVPPGKKPSFTVPPGACDCHVHLFGPYDRYPLVADRSYTTPESKVDDFVALLDSLGFDRGVIVHPSAHGFDNSITMDALRAYPQRFRAVALLQPDVSDAALDEMTEAGFRGVRANLLRHEGQAVYRGGVGLETLEALGPRLAERGWHAQLWIDAGDLIEVAPRVQKLGLPIVADHLGRMSADKGTDYPGFKYLCRLLEEGETWCKLSGSDRITVEGPPYHDADPFARALIQANPDRVVWGSDWPHVGYHDKPMPADADLLDLLPRWTEDAAIWRKILVDNPARLYGF